ncbi:MAG: SMP-30/gluconolactonase/LRE family protein [Gemmatimonadaceae bacterium]
MPRESSSVLPTGRVLHPVGRTIDVGNMPLAITVAPGGRFAMLLLSGWRERGLQVVDLDSGTVVQTLRQAGAFLGMTFSADGKSLYTSGAHRNVVYRYAWNGSRAALRDSIILAPPDSTSDHTPFPAGIALSRDGGTLYVVENMADSIAVVSVATNLTVQKLATGHYPYGVAVSPSGDVFVSAWGGSTVDTFHSMADGRLVSAASITIGRHPSALLLNESGTRLFATLSSTDRIAVVDTRTRAVINMLADSVPGAPSEGSTPDALALSRDGRRLFVAEADNNAVAVFELSDRDADRTTPPTLLPTTSSRSAALVGRVPVRWYPSALALNGDSLLVVSAKGRGTAPNPFATKDPRSYTLGQLNGTISIVPSRMNTALLTTMSRRVADANGWNAAHGAASHPPFQHVILVIKENRTYDQVLSDIPAGDGDTTLIFFPRAVSPNQHALAERFGLYDRFFTNAEVSAQGHPWTTSAYSTEYTEKVTPIGYANLRPDLDEGEVDEPSTGCLWTSAAHKGLTVRDYGEDVKPDSGDRGASGSAGRPLLPVRYLARRTGLAPYTNTEYPGFDLTIPDQVRADIWIKEFQGYVKTGQMPALEIVYLPRDHTAGTRPGWCTPRACVADNDLALGRVVDALSHSPFWKSTLMLVVEDDAQLGTDHVDSHRSVMLAVSP